MCDVQWIKLSTDIFSNRKIKQIQSIPNGDTFFVIWIKLLIMAAETNDGGQIYLTKDMPYTTKQLANFLGKSQKISEKSLEIFKNFQMISVKDGVISIKNWEKYQNVDGMERVREQAKIRMRNYRARQTVTENYATVQTNVTQQVTQRDATDKDIDKDIDIDIKEKPKKKSVTKKEKTIDDVLSERPLSEKLEKTVREFVSMRKSIKKPMNGNALDLMLNKLDKMASDEQTKIEILNQSIMNSWQGIFELDRRGSSKKAYVPRMTKEDEENLDFVFGRASS